MEVLPEKSALPQYIKSGLNMKLTLKEPRCIKKMKELFKENIIKDFSRLIQQFSMAFILIMSIACHTPTSSKGERMVTDMAGRTMEVPDTIKRVYVAKSGSLLLYAAAPELMICKTLWMKESSRQYLDSTYQNLPFVVQENVEEILKYHPDIIINCFTINKTSIDEADRLAEQTGIPVFLVEIDMDDYSKTFESIGKLLHKEEQTDRMTGFVQRYLDTISNRAKTIPEDKKVKVYYAEGECGGQTDPSSSVHSEVIDFVGAVNVANVDLLPNKGLSNVSLEQVLYWNPDVILCWTGWGNQVTTWQCVTSDKIWSKCKAVSQGRVYQIPYEPYGWFDRPPGTNRIIGTIWTANLLYPEIFPYDMTEVVKEYFRIFYHKDLSDKQVAELLAASPEGMLVSDVNHLNR